MIAKKHLVVIIVGACLLGLPSLSSQKNPVERPNKGVIHLTAVVDLDDGSFVATSVGYGTHFGRTTHIATGFMDVGTGAILSVSGVITASNGDEIWFVSLPDVTPVITGGTGRFEGATGTQTVVEMWDVEITEDPVTNTRTMSYSARLEGTITY
jgi:hypothetical protein